MRLSKIVLVFSCLVYNMSFAKTIYVQTGGSDANTGLTWGQSFKTLQKAISVSIANDQIWVAKGTYFPDEGNGALNNDRSVSFNLKNEVKMYGGFAGNETAISQRMAKMNISTLSGEIQQDANQTNNSYHVVMTKNVNANTLIDGFTITGGYATSLSSDLGSGWLNDGSGNGNSSNPIIANCIFQGNTSTMGGGLTNVGIDNGVASPTVTSCTFSSNNGPGGGGGIYNRGSGGISSPVITNCIFFKNSADNYGGAIFNDGSSGNCNPLIINCTFSGNLAGTGAGILNYGQFGTCNANIVNCILWGNGNSEMYSEAANPTISFCIVKGIQGTDPKFMNPDTGDLHVQFCSPAINMGSNTLVTASADRDGNPRINNTIVDIGAYEFIPNTGNVVFVNKAATGLNNGASWGNAFKTLQDALHYISCHGNGTEIWVAKGTYYPDEGVYNVDNDRNGSFGFRADFKIYGGFSGTETLASQRNPKINTTILSGEIQQDGDTSNNAFHVIVTAYGDIVNTGAIVDGFTISDGNANFSAYEGDLNNRGGGWLNYALGSLTISNPKINNCIFKNNRAVGGGAFANISIATDTANPTITNCSFIGNESYSYGGAIFNMPDGGICNLVITNCIFFKDSAGSFGGAFCNIDQYGGDMAKLSITNCSFSGNGAGWGGAISNDKGSLIVTNCIAWGNGSPEIADNSYYSKISNSIVKGGYTGINNLYEDPLFVNAAAGNLRLKSCSPAVNAGNNSAITESLDLDGNPRIINNIVDIGAYEFQDNVSKVIFVNKLAAGLNNGNSWANAFTSLQSALQFATGCNNGNQIWVAKGTYYPDEGNGIINNDRNAYFMLANGVAMYGGFTGTESSLAQRNWKVNVTILSGEIQQDNDTSNNAYHVIWSEYVNSSTTVDGFTITAGHAGGIDGGPGMNNWLGGAWINNGTGTGNFSNPTIINCDFISNTAALAGGALYNTSYGSGNANPAIINCRFIQNTSKGKLDGGGAIYNDALEFGFANPSISNCIFMGNSAVNIGGGIYNMASNGVSNPVITNCSFNDNRASNGGAIGNNASNPVIRNCIFWTNGTTEIDNQDGAAPIVSYSIVNGGYPGTGNLDKDPLFMNAASGNLHLQACSPAIDAGNNSAVTGAIDIDGNPRIKNGKVDMGAYELQSGSCCPPGNVIYVNKLASGQNNGNSWTDAFTSLQDALERAAACGSVNQVWVAKSTYYTDEGYGLTDNDRNLTFKLKNGIALYGGFTGTETNLSQRNGKINITILSGEIQQDNIKTNNAYFVVKADAAVNVMIDGFTITGGPNN